MIIVGRKIWSLRVVYQLKDGVRCSLHRETEWCMFIIIEQLLVTKACAFTWPRHLIANTILTVLAEREISLPVE